MKRILILCVFLAGCTQPMTNEQIIAETKKCEAAGLDARAYGNDLDMRVRSVQCWPREHKK